jgi:hypothetical protein
MMKADPIFNNNSNIFKLSPGDNKNFDLLGNEENKCSNLDSTINEKLKTINKLVSFDVPQNYIVDDLVININIARN